MAFVGQTVPSFQRVATHRETCNLRIKMSVDRRTCLRTAVGVAISLAASAVPGAKAAMYSAETKGDSFTPKGDLSKLEAYMPQIEAGYDALVELERNWNEKTKDFDGDVVRRVLGTVGVKSPLFNIRKSFLKSWQIISDTSSDYDLIDRLETEWNDVLNGISAIDFQLYSVSFTELEESKKNLAIQGKKALDDTIATYANLLKDLKSAA